MPRAVKPEITIELTCSLCPKTPTFSDISHLLTHISSKSHLSHRFKLQIRSQSENAAKDKLDEFDFWYCTNNLDALLAERLASKDRKRIRKQQKRKVSNACASSMMAKSAKEESKLAQEILSATPVYRAPVPRMHLWPIGSISSPTSTGDWDDNNVYSTPTMRRHVPNFAPEETGTLVGDIFNSKSATPWKSVQFDETAETDAYEPRGKNNVEKKAFSDCTTLKGVLWPGMDLFDSATPEMKRMRNQRKDDSVLEQMITTSNEVEPNEVVYHLSGEVHHVRDIFGPMSTENSPDQTHIPTPKKRKSRKTAALSDISVNAPHIRTSRPRKNAVAGIPRKRPSAAFRKSESSPRSFVQGSIPNPLANFGQKYAITTEEDEEFKITIGNMTKKRTLDVFQDAPEVSPGHTESTLEDHRFDFSGDRTNGRGNGSKASNYISPTPAAKQATMRGFGKENGSSRFLPTIHPRHHSATSASHIYPGQVFYDPILNPLYDPSFTRSFSTYAGEQTRYHEHLKLPPTTLFGLHSTLQGHYKSISPMLHPLRAQQYNAVHSNHGQGMDYGV